MEAKRPYFILVHLLTKITTFVLGTLEQRLNLYLIVNLRFNSIPLLNPVEVIPCRDQEYILKIKSAHIGNRDQGFNY